MKRDFGFTLIELIVTLAIVGILVTVAVPSFIETIRNNRLATQTNDFVTALSLARSEAIKRSQRVTVCKSADSATCAVANGWEQGWIVFVDIDNDAAVDAGEDILRVQTGLAGTSTLRGNANVANYVSYVSSGVSRQVGGALQMGTLILCDDRGFGDRARGIVLNVTGRVATGKATDTSAASCSP